MNCDFNHGLMRARGIERCAECGELTPEKVETSLEGITRQRDALKAELDKALEIIAEQRKKIDRLESSVAQYLTVIYGDHARAQLTSRHD